MRTLWIVAVLLMGVEGSLLEFGVMIMQETWTNPVTTYGSYGCYCSWEGQGQPKDATDRCCFEHNCCYGKVTGCDPEIDHYNYSRTNGVIVCGVGTPCQNQMCECDKAGAICLRDNLGTYNEEYANYPRCTEESPNC
uniref:PLA2(IIA)-Aze1 n=1 Tax=Azemiops feae TaxID=8773 RepID=A7X4N6_AZEFE|nr:PLA2(IIA)-Aze1 [Azemiops feae]